MSVRTGTVPNICVFVVPLILLSSGYEYAAEKIFHAFLLKFKMRTNLHSMLRVSNLPAEISSKFSELNLNNIPDKRLYR